MASEIRPTWRIDYLNVRRFNTCLVTLVLRPPSAMIEIYAADQSAMTQAFDLSSVLS